MKKLLALSLWVIRLGILEADAQSCTTNLGTPLVNITFGAGPNFGPPLKPGITNLSYVANNNPQDGYYTIASVSNNIVGGTWHSILRDHTGDPNGYFMQINASYQPSDFYVQTVNGFCQGTTYQFSAWVLNLMTISAGYSQPDIIFSVESTAGTVLQSYDTRTIPITRTPQWVQYSFFFTVPSGVSSLVLRMHNNAPGGNGNDLAIDDITFRPAGPAISIQTSAFSGNSGTICAGSPLSLTSVVDNCYLNTAYQWQLSADNGTTWSDLAGAPGPAYTASPGAAGTYLYRLEVAQSGNIGSPFCSLTSSPISVAVQPASNPSISIAPSAIAICAGSPATFMATASGGGIAPAYQWQVNGSNAGSNNGTFSTSALADGDVVSCVLTSSAACSNPGSVMSNTVTMSVEAASSPSISITPSAISICAGSPATFMATASGGGIAPAYQWQVNGSKAGSNSSTFTTSALADGDVVSCVLTSSAACSNPGTAAFNIRPIKVYPLPEVVPGQVYYTYASQPITVNPSITGAIDSILWTPSSGLSDNSIRNPVVTITQSTIYSLDVLSSDGCRNSGSVKIEVMQRLAFPSAFSPNGDGNNDVFYALGGMPGAKVKKLAVFGRWGERIFEVHDVVPGDRRFGWDGTIMRQPAPVGTYVYFAIIDPGDGTLQSFKGTVVLIK